MSTRGIVRRATLAFTAIILTVLLVGRAQAARPAAVPQLPVPPPFPTPQPVGPPLPLAPAKGVIPGWLHTSGTTIVAANNHPVRLAAVNWYGAESDDFVPGGLAYRPYMDILRTIKYLGFNTIRLPFSNLLVESNPIVRQHLDANPQFRGKHALDILDAIIAGARQVGLMVVLDDHRSDPGWTAQENGLWYSLPRYTPQGWINDWVTLARRYRNNPDVVGFDLRNEPHSNGPGLEILGLGYLHQGATWGPFLGKSNPASDWRAAAEQAGNAILRVDPHVLIIVEGTEVYPYHNPVTHAYTADLYWWGGNLAGAKDFPVVLNVPHQLVYSPHEYGPEMHSQRWITPNMTIHDWQVEMYNHWAYLLKATGPNAAPIWVGEFGTPTGSLLGIQDPHGNSQGAWFTALVHYLEVYPNVGWAYWAVNGTQSAAPTRVYGQRDSFGILTRDWAHLSLPNLLFALHNIQPR